MPRYKIIIEYDGAPFAGWQYQDNVAVGAARDHDGDRGVLRREGRWCRAPAAPTPASMRSARSRISIWRASATTDTIRDALNAHLRPHPVAILSAEKVRGGFRRAPLGGAAALSLSHRQPPARSRARARPRLAGAAPARRRGDARGGAAARRQARLHDVPLDRMPGQVAGEDARPARRVARGRRDPHQRRGALVPAQPGALDGRLAGAGRRRQMERRRSCRARSPPATARPAGRWRRRTGFIWCGWITEPISSTVDSSAQ